MLPGLLRLRQAVAAGSGNVDRECPGRDSITENFAFPSPAILWGKSCETPDPSLAELKAWLSGASVIERFDNRSVSS